ncbi:MAG: glycosyltransferase family 4 protein [Anaerolineae bacterium]
MSIPSTAILHYTAPPIIGGVEAVILAHARAFVEAGYPVTLVAGRGEAEALATLAARSGDPVDLLLIPELDSRHERVLEIQAELEEGRVPDDFQTLADEIYRQLVVRLDPFDNVIVHNVFTKRFNLPLTAALFRLLDSDPSTHHIAWCHDFDWTSPRSRSKVHPGYPWDLLRTYRQDMTYVVVSKERQEMLADLLGCPRDKIHVVYNGVDSELLLGLSDEGRALIDRLDLFEADLTLLMPVRVTRAKNIEFALKVVAALKGRGRRPKLVLTGPPDPHDETSMDYFHSLQALRAELGVEDEMRFVFESGPGGEEGLTIGYDVVADLYRACDVMFMPSHHEGFAMPVLEAGLVGMPVFCTAVPAAVEIGGDEVVIFDEEDEPDEVAGRLLAWAEDSAVHRLRRRVSKLYTWEAIFRRCIEPLLQARRPGAEG